MDKTIKSEWLQYQSDYSIQFNFSGNFTGKADPGFGLGSLTPVTESASYYFDPVKEDEPPQQPQTLNQQAIPITPTIEFVPLYYPPSNAEISVPAKKHKISRKKSASKRSSTRKSNRHSHGSKRSHHKFISPSHYHAKHPSKSHISPNQITAGYLNSYFDFLNSYGRGRNYQNQQDFVIPSSYGTQYSDNNSPLYNEGHYNAPNEQNFVSQFMRNPMYEHSVPSEINEEDTFRESRQ